MCESGRDVVGTRLMLALRQLAFNTAAMSEMGTVGVWQTWQVSSSSQWKKPLRYQRTAGKHSIVPCHMIKVTATEATAGEHEWVCGSREVARSLLVCRGGDK